MRESDIQWAESVLSKCMDKYRWVAERNKGGIPNSTGRDGRYNNLAGFYAWTNGFWMGILWQMYKYTRDDRYMDIAASTEEQMDSYFEEYLSLDHDVGFVWIPSSVYHYSYTRNEKSRTRALHAANLLAGRFNQAGQFIRAWNILPRPEIDKTGWAIIDCMMNIPLLYWAGKELGDPRFTQIADAHAHTVMKHFIREDGSVKHIAEFDPDSGAYRKSHGGQGYREGSAWTRGQSWAVYGFAIAYNCTGNKDYLDAARKVGDYILGKIPADGIIPIDFDQPEESAAEDSSAAAIIACGLLEIARASEKEKEKFEQAALKLLRTLDESRNDYGDGVEAIVQNCSDAYNEPETHHKTLIYADYYFIEACRKIADTNKKKECKFIW